MSTQKLLFAFLIIFIFSCGGDDEQAAAPVVEIPEDALYYFVGDVDGESVELIYTATNYVGLSSTTGGSNFNNDCVIDYGSLINDLVEPSPIFEVRLLNYYQGSCFDEPDGFLTRFSPVELEYALDSAPNDERTAMTGIMINDNFYSSDLGAQNGADFTITEVSESFEFNFTVDIEGTFNCTVYLQDDPSQSIQINNGRFKMPIQNF